MPSASGIARKIYDAMPRQLKRSVLVLPFAWRIGPIYQSYLNFLLESDKWNNDAHTAYQDKRLSDLLQRAINNVPYYTRYRRLLGRPPREILQEIDPIEKKHIQLDPEIFLDPTIPRSATYISSTGGTTGRPLKVILDKAGFQIEWAFMVAQWMRVGYRPGMRKATFRGFSFHSGHLWQENPVYDEIQFSPFAMTQDNLPLYVDRIKRYAPDFLYGYPSALTIIAKFLESHPEWDFPQIRGLLCGSENMIAGQRDYLEKIFQARVYSWYGMSEKVILAGECEKSSLYHAFPQYGITEVIDETGNTSSKAGSEGEIVGTGFMNRAMPFIRYRTGDHARIEADFCPGCGRSFLLLGQVKGRWIQEMVIGKHGAPISITALNMHGEVFKDVLQFQFHQKEIGKVVLKIVPGKTFNEGIESRILRALYSKTDREIEWIVEKVSSIELSQRGKSIFLIQELKEV